MVKEQHRQGFIFPGISVDNRAILLRGREISGDREIVKFSDVRIPKSPD